MSDRQCRHDFQCEGWTVNPATSICMVCQKPFVFWSDPQDAASFTAVPPALAEILGKPGCIRTYPPTGDKGIWRATLSPPLGHLDDPIRPYVYVGQGDTEQAAIDHLKFLEANDTWGSKEDV